MEAAAATASPAYELRDNGNAWRLSFALRTHYGSGLWRVAVDRRLGDYGRTVTSAQAASHRGKPVTCPGQFT